MSGGFFRGTSADQDTRFSNKTAKLLKTQKFAPELDQLIDMSKIKMDTLRPWIATRVTQFLGFEDEVLINFIYELLEGKNVDGKQIQIQLTGFMEKNTGKFMKELWGLLTSAQNTASGIPQQLLDEKAEEARQKKAEEHRIISEVRRKEDEKRALEQEVVKKEVTSVEVEKVASSIAPKPRSNSLSRGGKSPDGDQRNGTMDSRRPPSRSRSGSHISSKSASRSPRPASKRRVSRSVSRSPPPRFRRSRSPLRRGRSPNYVRRSRSPLRRAWSPINTRSPRRRRRSHSHSPRGRSPVAAAHSPRRRRSPQLSYSPRGRSPNVRSPRRRRSPVFTRSSPRRRKSPPRSPPRYRRRSPRYVHSPVRRDTSPPRRRHTAVSPLRHADSSPRRRTHNSSPRRGSPPRRVTQSSSPEAFSKSPQHRDSSASPQRRPIRKSSPQPNVPPASKGRLSKGSMSPVQQRTLSAYQQHSSRSPSPVVHTVKPVRKTAESPLRGTHRAAPVQRRRLSSSLSPRIQQRSPSLPEVSLRKDRSRSRSPLASSRGFMRERPVKTGQRTQKTSERLPVNVVLKKRTRSSSRESSLPDEDREGAPLKKSSISDANAGVSSMVNRQLGKVDEAIGSVSKSSSDDQHQTPGAKWSNTKDMESDENEDHGTASPVVLDDRKTSKRRRKEERRLRKEEKRRKREERHKRKEEKRANKFLSKGIASVTPPPDFDKRTTRSDDFDSPDEGKGEEQDMEIEQIKLENELRRKALDSIRAKKVVTS